MAYLPKQSQFGPCRRQRILVENSPGVWRYIAKIVPYGKSDGGFAVVPAYRGRGGVVLKVRALDTFSHLVAPPDAEIVDRRSVTTRIKLSFHSDGVTQVSAADGSHMVTSGKDPETGLFRGMGVRGAPFEKPVISGAVFRMTVWGLEHFPRTSIEKDTIRFSRLDLGRRGLLNRAAVLLEGYLIHRSHAVEDIGTADRPAVRALRWNGTLGIRERMDLQVCNIQSQESYLGIRCFRFGKPVVERHLSGYVLSSQRDRIEHTGLHVFYPALRATRFGRTLDRGAIPQSIIRPLGGPV